MNIQVEIDRCAANGGGTVTVPAGTYHSGTIYLKSNVTLHLKEGAVISGSPDMADYPPPPDVFTDGADQARGRALILGYKITNAAVEGAGTICGNGEKFLTTDPMYDQRPMLLRFVDSSDIRVSGIKLRTPAAWTFHMRNCENIAICGVDVYSHANHNNDGMDIDSCRHVKVTDCHIDSGDDALCIKSTAANACEDIRVRRCVLLSEAAAFKIGTETYGDVRDLDIAECRIEKGEGGAIKMFSADGAVLENILIRDLEIIRAANPLFIRLGARGRVYGDLPQKNCGAIRNITVKGLHGTIFLRNEPILSGHLGSMPVYCHNALTIMGLPEKMVENITLEDIDLVFPGSSPEVSRGEVLERPDGYPELGYYGLIPASVMFLRHVKEIDIRNLKTALAAPDCRQEIITENVMDMVMEEQ